MMFCWDDAKFQSNIEKHKFSFELAPVLFLNIKAEVEDTRFEYGENRFNAYGYIKGRLFVCTYTPRCGWRHVISLRKASKKEIERYG